MHTTKRKPTGATRPPAGITNTHEAASVAEPAEQGNRLATPTAKRAALQAILAAHPGTSCPAQCERIRAALEQFPLTTFEAMRFLDCYDPRPRVLSLRAAGLNIVTHWRTVITESGDRHRVGLYVLHPAAINTEVSP